MGTHMKTTTPEVLYRIDISLHVMAQFQAIITSMQGYFLSQLELT